MDDKNNNQKRVPEGGEGSGDFFLEGNIETDTKGVKKLMDIFEKCDIKTAEEIQAALKEAGLKGTVIDRKNGKFLDANGGCGHDHSKDRASNPPKPRSILESDMKQRVLEALIEKKTQMLKDEEKKENKPKFSLVGFLARALMVALLVIYALEMFHSGRIGDYLGFNGYLAGLIWLSVYMIVGHFSSKRFKEMRANIRRIQLTGVEAVERIRKNLKDIAKVMEEKDSITKRIESALQAAIKDERKQKAVLQSERDLAVNELASLKTISEKMDSFHKSIADHKEAEGKKVVKKAKKKSVKKSKS